MNSPSLPGAVVFDLDGTLIDSAPDLHVALNRLLAELGRRELGLTEATLMIGNGAKKLVERALAASGDVPDEDDLEAMTSRFLEIYEGSATALTRTYPYVNDVLGRLKSDGLTLGLCTNKPHRATVLILDELGLHGYFDAVFGGDSIAGVRKPDPRSLLATIERMGSSPADTVMVGDNGNDVGAARNAGIPIILVEGGYTAIPARDLGADGIIRDFRELPEALARL